MQVTSSGSVPQQARAVATRNKLIEAVVRSLCSRGYAKTTTTVVAQAAGVSQGALFKHFGSKQHLIAATTEHLFHGLVEDFRSAFQVEGGNEVEDQIPRLLNELWVVFLKPELYAVIELYIAARTDEQLRQALIPVMQEHRDNLINEARRLFPDAAVNNPRFESAVDAIMSAFQGAAMSAAVLQDASHASELSAFLEHLCRLELQPPYGVM
jgi:AcrR family transcriptional regulator